MADRSGENPKPMKPLKFTHVQHADGTREWNQDRGEASTRQTEALANLNDPAKITRERTDLQTQQSEFATRRGKPLTLDPKLNTKNLLP